MKSTKIVSAILVAGLVSVSAVSANMHSEMNSDKTEIKKEHKMGQNSMKMHNKKNKMADHKMNMGDKKAKMKEMIKPFFDKLPKETQDKLNELKAERKAHMDEEMKKYEEMREKMKSMSDEELKKHMIIMKEKQANKMEEMKSEMKEHFAKVKEIVGDDTPEARAFLKKAEEVHSSMREKGMKMRGKMDDNEMKNERMEMKENRMEMKMKYKKAFAEKLENRLDKISDEKLEKVIVKIDAMIEKFENNTKLSEDKKERLLAQLEALKDVINDKLDKTSSEIDVEELLK